MRALDVQEIMDLFKVAEAERLAAIERSRRLCAELVKEYGEYRGPLPQRRVAGLGALKGGRFVVEVETDLFQAIWPHAAGVTGSMSIIIDSTRLFLIRYAQFVKNASKTETEFVDYMNFMAKRLLTIQTEVKADMETVKRHPVYGGFDFSTIVLPKDKRFDVEDHENFHFDCSVVIYCVQLYKGGSAESIRDKFNEFFLEVLSEVQSESSNSMLHFKYREIIAPYYAINHSLGFEEIFARAATAEKNGVSAVIEEDIRTLESCSSQIPANYPDIVRFCLKEIHDYVVRVYGSHAGLIQAARQHLGLMGEIPGF